MRPGRQAYGVADDGMTMVSAQTGFTAKSFGFLEGLAAHNDRDWFNTEKQTYRDYLETPFAELLEALTNRLRDSAYPLEGGAKTMFRMNRDVRFSADKSPYKTSVAGLMTPSGTKTEASGLVYLQIDADGGFAAAGYHALSPKQLAPIRQAMIDRDDAFADVLAALKRRNRTLDHGDSLASMPKGFSDQDAHRHANAIRLKSLIVREDLPKVAWTSGDVIDRVESLARDAAPLLTFQKPA